MKEVNCVMYLYRYSSMGQYYGAEKSRLISETCRIIKITTIPW